MKSDRFLPGINTLLSDCRHWLRKRRVGLLSHAAALDTAGRHAADCLRAADVRLVALFGPEHGFFGAAAAGRPVAGRMHPSLQIPVYSLYGERRCPDPEMLSGIDTLVVDLQDLGTRCYTYVSTLSYAIEAACAAGKEIIVADRPVPLPNVVDGPVTAPGCESFLAALPVPMVYGMTPGETARWIRDNMCHGANLKVAPMKNYRCGPARGSGWPPWVPPSPGIASWESGLCYPATVFSEALPQLDHGAGSGLPFQVLGARWLNGSAVCDCLKGFRLPGVAFFPHAYALPGGAVVEGLRLVVRDHDAFRPVRTAVAILLALETVCGARRIWKNAKTRPRFFDTLVGTPEVRGDIVAGVGLSGITSRWRAGLRKFKDSRESALLYRRARAK